MESWANDFIKKAEKDINIALSQTLGVQPTSEEDVSFNKDKLHSTFK